MTTMTDTYKTPEGFELARPLLMPEARRFEDVLTFIRSWDFATMSHRNGDPGPEHIEDMEFEGNRITPFCSVKQPGRSHMAVRPTQATLDALSGELFGMDDSLSFSVIYHESRDRCLVLISHNRIIGQRYLAYIDPESVPMTL